MDNGKIRMQQFNKAMIIEAYASEEVTLTDINWVLENLRICYAPPFLIIVVKSGSYELSPAAKMRLLEDDDILKVAYVAQRLHNTQYAVNASNSYFQNKKVFICDSIESAYMALTGTMKQQTAPRSA